METSKNKSKHTRKGKYMANTNQKHQKQPDQQPTPPPIVSATPLELSDEELGQVVGGVIAIIEPPAPDVGGLPSLMSN